jgi:hypothetical protein
MNMKPKSLQRSSVNVMRDYGRMMLKSIKRVSGNIVRWKKGHA